MVAKSPTEIERSINNRVQRLSPQIRIDAAKGPFYWLASRAVAEPLSEISIAVERIALLSTGQFPNVVTPQEALGTARSFGLSIGRSGFSSGLAYFITARRPTGGEVFSVAEGAVVSTRNNSGQSFRVVSGRSLTAANADAFFNPSTRRYELPVRVEALSAGTAGNIAARTLANIVSGAPDFEGARNLAKFTGGSPPQTIGGVYRQAQQRIAGLDVFSKGGLQATIVEADVDRIQAVAYTYSFEYPRLFYRLPDKPAFDIWLANTPDEVQVTETFVAGSGQSQFFLSKKPVLGVGLVEHNGIPAAYGLSLDHGQEVGRSTRERSFVELEVPALQGDFIEVTYTYDAVLERVQNALSGQLDSDVESMAGALLGADILVRYARDLPVAVRVTGTALGTFSPQAIEQEVLASVGNYLSSGTEDAPILGGVRTSSELRDVIRSTVPGISTLSIPTFGRKSLGVIVEAIDIPRNARVVLETAADLQASFT